MRRKHRWLMGAVSGFFFGLFLGTTLLLFGVIPLQSPLLTMLPVAFIVLGAAWGSWGPIGRRPPQQQEPTDSALVQPAVPDTPRPLTAAPDATPPPPPPPPPLPAP